MTVLCTQHIHFEGFYQNDENIISGTAVFIRYPCYENSLSGLGDSLNGLCKLILKLLSRFNSFRYPHSKTYLYEGVQKN